MHDKQRHIGVTRSCGVVIHHPHSEARLTQGKGLLLYPHPTWWPALGQSVCESSLEDPGCGLAPCPYGAAAGEVCRGPEETQPASLHQGREEGVLAPWGPAL